MKACPSPQQLEQFVHGQLSDFDRSAIDSHLQTCCSCQVTVNLLRSEAPATEHTPGGPEPAAPAPPPGQLPPELLDHPRYRIVGLLDVGGMGAVYRAEHRILERPVVLKAIRPDLLANPEQVRRFLREARFAASLLHPHVVTVFEAECVNDSYFLVMEHLEGTDLGRLVRQRGPLPVGEACEWARQAALGLQHIHERGLVHRDIKPSNLFLVGGRQIKILDLGLAVLRAEHRPGDRSGLTQRGQILGTIDYMAPEQWEDCRDVDIRADIYSLGCTLYFLLTGVSPFGGPGRSSVMKQMWAHALASVPPVRARRPEVPLPVADTIARMMAKTPDARFSTPAEVAAALEPFAALVPGTPRARGNGVAASPDARRVRRLAAVMLLAALIFLTGVASSIYWHRGWPDEDGPAGFAGGPPIKVGVLHSLTGTMAISEKPVTDATLFAIEEINAAGGVLGRKVEAVVEDGASDGQVFATKAEKLITQDEVRAVFGCWTSASRKTVKPLFEKHNHLLFYPVQYEGLEQSPNVVYTGAAPNQQIIPAVKWCCGHLKKRRLFLVGSDYVFPRAANAIIRDHAESLGARVVGEEYLLLGSSEAGGTVEKILKAEPDVILNTINGDSNVAFFRALRGAGVTSEKIPTVSFSVSEEELGSLSPMQVKGDYAAWNYFQSIEGPRNEEFVRRFRARYGPGRILSDPMESAYVSVHLWAKAVREANSDDVAAVRDAVKNQSFDAPGGTVRIDPETQHAIKYIRIGRINESNRFEVVFRSDVPINPVPFPPTRTRAEWHEFLTDLQLRWGGKWANPGR